MAAAHSAATDEALVPLAEKIWAFNGPLSLGSIHLGHRMTVVQLANNDLWLHSPVLLDQTRRTELEQLGPVEYLVAPSTFHDLYWDENLAAYPQAQAFCAPGVDTEHPKLRFSAVLGAAPAAGWADQIDQLLLAGMPKVNEVVFFHRASGTLIVADAVFSLLQPANFATKAVLSITGTNGKIAVSRIFRHYIDDKAALRRSIDQVLSWDFDTLVVGHGQIIQGGARLAVEQAFRFLG